MRLLDKIPADKRAHLKLGAVAALVLGLVLLIAIYLSMPGALAAGVLTLAIGYERVQRLRGEGTQSWSDAAATAAPGLALAALLFFTWPGK